MLLGNKSFKKQTRKEGEVNPFMMGTETMEESEEEKHLGDKIPTNGFDASISSTVNKRRCEINP